MNVSKATFALALLLTVPAGAAHAAVTYVLKYTNAGVMPISPAAIYVKAGQSGAAEVGTDATIGFKRLCQAGDAATRTRELKELPGIASVIETLRPILPGESHSVEVRVDHPGRQSVHFESMYGKSKDLCAVAAFNSHALVALQHHVTRGVRLRDAVVQTGAFLDPILPPDHSYINTCAGTPDAVSCLRELAPLNPMSGRIRFFSGYSPSAILFLEKRYGPEDAGTLAIPAAGAVQLELSLKH